MKQGKPVNEPSGGEGGDKKLVNIDKFIMQSHDGHTYQIMVWYPISWIRILPDLITGGLANGSQHI